MEQRLLLFLLLVVFPTKRNGIAAAEFKFTATTWNPSFKMAPKDVLLPISCQTNDPNATTTLEISGGDRYEDATNFFGSRLQQTGQTFTLLVKEVDNKNFRCKAVDKAGKIIYLALGMVIVTIMPDVIVPVLIPNTNIKHVEVNGNANITCEAEGTLREVKLNWYRKDKDSNALVIATNIHRSYILKSSTAYEMIVLEIKNANKKTEGTYTCIRDDRGVKTEKSIEVKLEAVAAPTVRLSTLSTIVVREGKGPILSTCHVTGSPKPKRAWYFKNKVVADCPDRSTTSCFLEVFNPIYTDDGVYTCHAENIAGSANVSVHVEVIGPVALEKAGNKVLSGLSQPVDIYCILRKGNPLPRITWYYQPYPCSAEENCIPKKDAWQAIPKSDKSVSVSPEQSTPTKQSVLSVEGNTQSAFYRCIANNTLSIDNFTLSLRRIENPPLQFKIIPLNPKINENQTLHMECMAQFNFFEKTVWLKNERALPSYMNRSVEQTQGLWKDTVHIHKASVNDSGNYSCVGTRRRGGTVAKYSFISVYAIRKPEIDNFVDEKFYEDNITATILCHVSGNPTPRIKWYFNDNAITSTTLIDASQCQSSTSGFYFIQNDKNRHLVICRPSYEKHIGNYSCHASSSLGFAEKTKEIIIYALPRIFNWKSTATYLVPKPITLRCSSRGFPPPVIKWFKVEKNGAYRELKSKSYKNRTGVLMLGASSASLHGNYSCRSTNGIGLDEKFIYVTVEELPQRRTGGLPTGSLVAFIVVPIAFVAFICLIYVCWYRRKLEKQYVYGLNPGKPFKLDPNKTLLEQSSDLPYDREFEFPLKRLNLIKIIGSGAFGEVWLAGAAGMSRFNARDRSPAAMKERRRLRSNRRNTFVATFQKKRAESNIYMKDAKDVTEVAVKTLKDDAEDDELRDLASELKMLIHLGHHKNLVNLLGACTRDGKLLMILEFCHHGSLRNFLKERRDIFEPDWFKLKETMAEEVTYIDLMQAALSVAKGMEYLSLRKCIHRDLAARNVLIDEHYTAKIADFGLARDVQKKDYYRKETKGLLPIKWMAPESLFNQIYTEKTDVWSFGIFLWEIFTLGGSPYHKIPPSSFYEFIADGGRMTQPDHCPDPVFKIMTECWEEEAGDRPSFTFLQDRLEDILHERIEGDVGTVTDDGYMAPQDQSELRELRESKRKSKLPKSPMIASSPAPLLPKEDPENEKEPSYENMTGGGRSKPNSYVELRTRDSFSSNEYDI